MTVRLLNNDQYNLIAGKEYVTDMRFNPVKDADGNWIISEEEVEQSVGFEWVKELPQIEFKPIHYKIEDL